MRLKKYLLFPVLLLALAGLLAKPAYYLYRDVSFSWQERSQEARIVKDYADFKNISFGRYPWELITLLENNPETLDFVLNYPFRQEESLSLSGYSREEVPLFLQWDAAWGYERYGASFHAVTGCGPTALAMAGYYLTGDEAMNPKALAEFSQKNGYYAPGYGTSWTLISEGGPKLGLTVKELPLVKGKIDRALENSHPVILAMGPGDFTTEGHYIVLTAVTEEGYRLNDPNSRERSARIWTYEELEGQIKNIWEISV